MTREEALELGLDLARRHVNYRMSRHYAGVTYDDFLGPANLGVAEALYHWDEVRPFGPYAQRLIRGRVQDYLREIDPLSRGERKKVQSEERERPLFVAAEQADWVIRGKFSNRRSPPAPARKYQRCHDCGKHLALDMVKCPSCGYQENYLTPMEVKCWERITRGMQRKAAAFELGISHKTLDQHMMHVAQKLKCKSENAATLTRLWFELGMDEKLSTADEKGRVSLGGTA